MDSSTAMQQNLQCPVGAEAQRAAVPQASGGDGDAKHEDVQLTGGAVEA